MTSTPCKSSVVLSCIVDGVFESLGVVCSDIESEGRLSERTCEGRRSIGVVDASWRLVNDRTDANEEERSVSDRADAFDRDLVCIG